MMGDALGEVVERLRRSTVRIGSGGRHFGSGVVWSDRRIVTNAHVLGSGDPRIEPWNGRRVAARVVKTDRRRDLAALQIDCDGVPAAAHGDSGNLRPGELLIAVGSPFGFSGAASTGVFHNTGALAGSARTWIVSDVRLAPGNSGGPLANARGEVVGINTMLAGRMALSIPAASVARFLESTGARQPGLGVVVRPMEPRLGQPGFLVLEVLPQSAAERASLKPGDLLVGAAGNSFRSLDDFEDALETAREGRLQIEFRRGDPARIRRVVALLDRQSPRAA